MAADERIVLCECCGSEGYLYDHNDDARFVCEACEGTGGEIIETRPIDLDDLDDCAPPIGEPA
jgi:hypothetical protein